MAAKSVPADFFTVGLVCALPIELAAASEVMDEEFADIPSLATDSNIYSFGRVGNHNVVAACLPAGQMGTNSASAVASEMKSRFPSLRFGVLVGIGGGVPSPESDIRLGDVVISQPVGQYGGVVQYDFGKTGPDGRIARTGSLNAPPPILLNALAKLRSNVLRRRTRITEYLSNFSSLPDFTSPGPDQDVLFSASSQHVPGPTCVQCRRPDEDRKARTTQHPVLFFGTIASGNQVMKDGLTRDRYSKELGEVLCFEMEAAGLMNVFPCLVVRGICDYADAHKNKQWQPYAAATAAASTKELLYTIPQLKPAILNQSDRFNFDERESSFGDPAGSVDATLVPSVESLEETEELSGLIQLWPDPTVEDMSKVQTTVDLIAIHGLAGHPFKTWSSGEKMWLRDFLPWELPKVRIMTYGYDAELAFTSSKFNIRHYATQLLDDMMQLRTRRKEGRERKIIFVCHSLGGIVFKQAVIIAHEKGVQYRSIRESMSGVVFLGTPHRGTDVTYWSKLLMKLGQIAGLDKLREDLVSNLDTKSAELGTICSHFLEHSMRLQVFSFYELHGTPAHSPLVVDESSAVLHSPNETPLLMEADHSGMPRFETSSSRNCVMVTNCIAELIDVSEGPSSHISFNMNQWAFVSALRAIDAVEVFNRIPAYSGKSSQWFLEHSHFQSWTSLQGSQVIWLYGPAGSGKTILMGSVVASLAERGDLSADPIIRKPISFYFDGKDATRRTSGAFVRSVLDQILRDQRTSFVMKYLDGYKLKEIVESEDSLWMCLSTIIERCRGIMFQLVIDAVDEVLQRSDESSEAILDRLQRLLNLDSSGRLRVLISHREKPPSEFSYNNDVVVVNVDNTSTQDNVRDFIRVQIRRHLEKFRIPASRGQDVEERIVEISQGNFLHAKLAWERFSKGLSDWSRGQIEDGLQRLGTMSNDLVEMYCKLLAKIPNIFRDRARISFAILRVCEKKLTSHQLAFLATLHGQLDCSLLDLSGMMEQCADFEAYLTEACAYIVRKSGDDTVDFAHISARDLFTGNLEVASLASRKIISTYSISDPDSHAIMHTLCMAIFRLEDRDERLWEKGLRPIMKAQSALKKTFTQPVPQQAEIDRLIELGETCVTRMSRTPCFVYAIRYYFVHYDRASYTLDIDRTLTSFLSRPLGFYVHILWFEAISTESERRPCLAQFPAAHTKLDGSLETSLFQALARSDCPRLIKTLIGRGVDVNHVALGSTSRREESHPEPLVTPLSWAILCIRRNSFLVLLHNEFTEINFPSYRALKPIHHAARCLDDSFFIQRLVEHSDTDVNVRCLDSTPLHEAILNKNAAAVETLLGHADIDIWRLDDKGETPYSLAFNHRMWEHMAEKMIALFSNKVLKMKISGSSQLIVAGVHGWTHVEEAIMRSDPGQVLVMDPVSRMNALTTYAYFGRKKKLVWLLERLPSAGFALRNIQDQYDILHLCANHDWEDLVHLLARRYGLKSLDSDHVGRTIIHWALEHNWDFDKVNLGDYSTSQLDAQDRDGLTAIHLAVMNRNMDALEIMAVSGANCFLKDRNGMSPAHLAAELGYRKALEYFIELPKREYGRTKSGASLLHLIALWFDGHLVRRFVGLKTALVNVVDKQRRTPLHYAAMVDNYSSASHLIELGCMVDARNKSGMTALHEAIRDGATSTVRLLLEWGADARATDGFGQSCLHLCLRYGHGDLVPVFLALHLDINAVDMFGMSPLHRACGAGGRDLIWSLLNMGAQWDRENNHRQTPLSLAVERQDRDVVLTMLAWSDKSTIQPAIKRRVLRRALRVARELDDSGIQDILLASGAKMGHHDVKVRRTYMVGPTREDRWPLVRYTGNHRSYGIPIRKPRRE